METFCFEWLFRWEAKHLVNILNIWVFKKSKLCRQSLSMSLGSNRTTKENLTILVIKCTISKYLIIKHIQIVKESKGIKVKQYM